MPKFLLSPRCERILATAGITDAELVRVGDCHDFFSVSLDFSCVTLANWPRSDRIILVDGRIRESRGANVLAMEPFLVIAFTPILPAGRITRDHDMEEILAYVAESFAVPMRCHREAPFSTLYDGPCDGKIEMKRDKMHADHEYILCGSYAKGWAHRVYQFDMTRYLAWLKGQKL